MNVYIDCGANLGQGFERLKSRINFIDYKVFMFDILPSACNFLKNQYPEAMIYNQGVWNCNTIRVVKQENAIIENVSKVGHESNILQDKHAMSDSGLKSQWENYELNCIDFSEFLVKNFKQTDNILLKIDIEGAEYEVFDRLIETKTLNFIKQVHVEWHSHLRTDKVKDIFYYFEIFKKNNIIVL